MLYALVVSNVAWAVLLGLVVRASRRAVERERAHFQRREDGWYERQGELLNRIQAPQIAVAQSLPEDTGPPPYISAFNDDALAEHEVVRMTVPKAAD